MLAPHPAVLSWCWRWLLITSTLPRHRQRGATVVSTNVLPGRTAVLLAALFKLLRGVHRRRVAKTSAGHHRSASITSDVIAAACSGHPLEPPDLYYGIPSSSSHALIGGISALPGAIKRSSQTWPQSPVGPAIVQE